MASVKQELSEAVLSLAEVLVTTAHRSELTTDQVQLDKRQSERYTVKPPNKGPSEKGTTSLQRMLLQVLHHIALICFDLQKEDNLRDKDRGCVPQSVLYSEGSTVIIMVKCTIIMEPLYWEFSMQ